MSPISKFCHLHPKIVTKIKSPTSMSPNNLAQSSLWRIFIKTKNEWGFIRNDRRITWYESAWSVGSKRIQYLGLPRSFPKDKFLKPLGKVGNWISKNTNDFMQNKLPNSWFFVRAILSTTKYNRLPIWLIQFNEF